MAQYMCRLELWLSAYILRLVADYTYRKYQERPTRHNSADLIQELWNAMYDQGLHSFQHYLSTSIECKMEVLRDEG